MKTTTAPPNNETAGLNKYGVRRIIQVLSGVLIIGVTLFLSAGRLDWWPAWIYLGVYILLLVYNSLTLMRNNPDMINERGRMAKNQKIWDRVIMAIYLPLSLSVMALAGLDSGRFGWSSMPLWGNIAGFILVTLSYLLIYSTMRTNAFLSTVVRIQDERGHQVVSSGPYRYVRHPMYAGMPALWLGTCIFLGSWWALIPGILIIILFIVRTALEDKMLQEELPGYIEYTQQTQYRLLPYVW